MFFNFWMIRKGLPPIPVALVGVGGFWGCLLDNFDMFNCLYYKLSAEKCTIHHANKNCEMIA